MVTVNPLAPPSITSATLNSSQFSLEVNGDSGPDYAIEISSNLVEWNTLLITNSPSMPWAWTNTDSAILPAQFYRIKTGPPLP
jgi:hypothetical protein